jgi:hypothetical protein
LYQHAAENGDPLALLQTAWLLEGTGRIEEAIGFYRRAAESSGSIDALKQAARLLTLADRVDEAARLLQYGLEPGGAVAGEWT